MTDAPRLLADLQPLQRRLQEDLLERSGFVPELGQRLRHEWERARQRERTAQTFETWRDDQLAQAAVMWILACVFVRFLEDNRLVTEPGLSGPGERLGLARDRHTLYFQQHSLETDREYLYAVFASVADLPAARDIFDRRHNPVWSIGLSGDAATELLGFWQQIDPASGELVHDFTDPAWDTRFLGDLYQDLSESARKKYALLQTPDFVLEFILDRTLSPAIDEFGYREVTLIDPACGSGHFLLEAFERLFRLSSQNEPAANLRELAQRALDQVAGVDVNPFAVTIARFRLLLAALRVSRIRRLADAPAFRFSLAAGDSLLHGPRPGGERQMYLDPAADPLKHVYDTEDVDELRRLLGRRYHVVVGNPPYITPKDAALNRAYRDRYKSCHRQYSLAVPFMERLFDLALAPRPEESAPTGYVGMITTNTFMKREFGKKLVERFLPKWDVTHVIDTDKAQLSGHATGTVILFGRHRHPTGTKIRVVSGLRKEEPAPSVPRHGRVWTAILSQVDQPGSQSDFVSVADMSREAFHRHPWSIGGGGAAELRSSLEQRAHRSLRELGADVGFLVITGEDNCLLLPADVPKRRGIKAVKPIGHGESIRDWACSADLVTLWPYDEEGRPLPSDRRAGHETFLWPCRTSLKNRKAFGVPVELKGIAWWALRELYADRLRAPLSIAFAEIATHNHFVLDRGGKVFNQTAPVIKLPPETPEEDHLGLLGLLNSSTGCFWLKQVCHDKGAGGIGGGIAAEDWEHRFAFNGSNVACFPLPKTLPSEIAKTLDSAAATLSRTSPRERMGEALSSLADAWSARTRWEASLSSLRSLQEELDWESYGLFGLLNGKSPVSRELQPVSLGERAFEIVMARRMLTGDLDTAWFDRHGSTPITEMPAHWPERYRRVVQRRIEVIETNPQIALIEQPEYKRRWNVEPWDEQLSRALRDWLLDRLETDSYWSDGAITTVASLADLTRRDEEFVRVAALYRDTDTFDVTALVAELVESEAVPFLPALRYRPSGLRKREQWERTWDLQRREDVIDARTQLAEGHPDRLTEETAKALKTERVGEIPVPPKYRSADFLKSTFWRLRGKLAVPKERFVSYPFCERDADPTLVIAWAGWDHLQQAKALATYYVQMKESEGWPAERLVPLLAGLLDLLPWLKQWHNDVDPEYGVGMGEYFEGFVDEECRALGVTRDAVRRWMPPPRGRRRGTS